MSDSHQEMLSGGASHASPELLRLGLDVFLVQFNVLLASDDLWRHICCCNVLDIKKCSSLRRVGSILLFCSWHCCWPQWASAKRRTVSDMLPSRGCSLMTTIVTTHKHQACASMGDTDSATVLLVWRIKHLHGQILHKLQKLVVLCHKVSLAVHLQEHTQPAMYAWHASHGHACQIKP